MYVYIGFKTFFYVVRHLDSIVSYLPIGLHLGFFRSWPSLFLPSSFSSVFLVLSFVLASTSVLFWAVFLLPFSEHGCTTDKYHYGDKTKEDEMDRAYSAQGGDKNCIRGLGVETWKIYFKDLGAEGMKILKMDLQEIGCEGVNSIRLSLDRGKWRTLVSTLENSCFPRMREIFWLAEKL